MHYGVNVRFLGLLERRIAFMFRASKYRKFQSLFDIGERFMATEKWIGREIARNAQPAAKRGARALSNEPHARAAPALR